MSKSRGGMGFCDLKAFNLALLAKQGWRLLQDDHSLFYRVFKSKYFPKYSFLKANVKQGCSFAWCSLTAARKVLVQGSRWRVGDGNAILVYQERWLLVQSSSGFYYTIPKLSPFAMVSDLIDHEHEC